MAVGLMASSPLTPLPSSDPTVKLSSSQPGYTYRETRELPFELAQHVKTYFEENMFMQGLRLLQSIVSADASAAHPRPMIIPPSSYLSLIATLVVHPTFTTRTTSHDKLEQACAALRLLHLLNKTAGPVNAGFYNAFTFNRYDTRPIRQRDEDEDEDNQLNITYFTTESLWSRAEDFWAVVGWALNCSCLSGMYITRWEHWSVWLDFMLDVLEADWQIHIGKETCEESLLWQYIELAPGSNTRSRRIMRAVFADGSTRLLNEFREIFRKELKEPTKEGDIKKREVDVNIEDEIYGDYMAKDDSDSASENEPTTPYPKRQLRTSRRATPRTSNQSLRSDYDNEESHTSSLGSPKSIAIRIRLLHLLVQVAAHPTLTSTNPTAFPGLDDLYLLFVEFIKPLPLPTFQQIISPSIHDLNTNIHLALLETLLQRMVESSTSGVNPDICISQTRLEREYLPFAASRSSIDANCRVGLLLESMIRLMARAAMLKKTKTLVKSVQDGVERRISKAEEGMDSRRKGGKKDGDDVGWQWLVESGERMVMVVDNLSR